MYGTALDLHSRIGATELAQLAAPGDARVTAELMTLTVTGGDRSAYSAAAIAAADAALVRIEGELSSSSRTMDSYIAPRYPLPLTAALIESGNLAQVCCDMARFGLHRTPPKDVNDQYDRRLAWLRDISKGRASLGAEDTSVATPEGRVVTRSGVSAIDWSTH